MRKKILQNVRSLSKGKNTLIIRSTHNDLYLEAFENLIYKSIKSCRFLNANFWKIEGSGYSLINDLDKQHKFEILDKKFIAKYVSNDICYGSYWVGNDRKLVKFNISTNRLIWLAELQPTIFYELYNELLVVSTGPEYCILDKNTGEIIHSQIVNELASETTNSKGVNVNITLGIHDGILWLTLSNSSLVGFKVENPSEVYHIELPEYFEGTYHIQHSQLDVENKMIFGLFGSYYWEIDLDSSEYQITTTDISSEISKTGITPSPKGMGTWPFTNKYVYFGQGGAWADDDAYLGKFNRKTKKIDWCSKEMGEEGTFKGINNLAFANEHLYVLDDHKTLHILSEGD